MFSEKYISYECEKVPMPAHQVLKNLKRTSEKMIIFLVSVTTKKPAATELKSLVEIT